MKKTTHNILIALFISSLFYYTGCAGGKYYSLGSPEHHFATGMKLMERYNLNNVEREFSMARKLNADYAPAYAGLAMVSSARGDFDGALGKLKEAREKSKTNEDHVAVAMGAIKVYTDLYLANKNKEEALSWIAKAEEAYKKGLSYDINNPALYFFMGNAYKVSGKYDEAEASFRKVLELKAGYTTLARKELDLLSKTSAK